MRIKLAIVEKNERFLSSLVNALNKKYSEKLEIHTFTDVEMALSNIQALGVNVFLVSSDFAVDVSRLPRGCAFAYLVGATDNGLAEEYPVIYKFKGVDEIYNQTEKICPQLLIEDKPRKTSSCKTVVFSSPCGGCGTSTVAAAFSLRMSSAGFKTLYLNLEGFGSSDVFFNAEGKGDMSDLGKALKAKRRIIRQKLDTCVRRDPSGVYFYSQAITALHILELSSEEKTELLKELKDIKAYDYIVVDMDYPLSVKPDPMFTEADTIVFVSDGENIPNLKVCRAYTALETQDNNFGYGIASKAFLVYNRTRSKTAKEISNLPLPCAARIRRIEMDSADVKTLLEKISLSEELDNLR